VNPKKTRVLLIDDHTVFRQGLAHLINSQPGLELRLHCGGVREGLALLASSAVDVVLLDLDLGPDRGIDFLARARRNGFQGSVLILTAGVSEEDEEALRLHSISGVVRKDVSIESLAAIIRQAAADRFSGEPPVRSSDRPTRTQKTLTSREAEVLRLVMEGYANKEIAGALGCSEPAVKGIIQQLFHKSGTRTRSQLVRVVLEQYDGPYRM
jgi:two-component system, NarL family, nitrate/nitrite response regulator NarL